MRLTTFLCLLVISMALLAYSHAAPTHPSAASSSVRSSPHGRAASSIRGRPVSTQTKQQENSDSTHTTASAEPEAEPPTIPGVESEEEDLGQGPEDPEDLGPATTPIPSSPPTKPTRQQAAAEAPVVDASSASASSATTNKEEGQTTASTTSNAAPVVTPAPEDAAPPASPKATKAPAKNKDTPAAASASTTNSETNTADDVKAPAAALTASSTVPSSTPSTPASTPSAATSAAAAAPPGDVDSSSGNEEAKMSATESAAAKEDDTSLPTDGAPFAVAPSLDARPLVPSSVEDELNAIENIVEDIDDPSDPAPSGTEPASASTAASKGPADSTATSASTSTSVDAPPSGASKPSAAAASYSELEQSSAANTQSSLGKPIAPSGAPASQNEPSLGAQTEAMAPEPRKRPQKPKPTQRTKPSTAKETAEEASATEPAAAVKGKKKPPQADSGAEVDNESTPAPSRPLPSVSGPEPAAAAEPAPVASPAASSASDNTASTRIEPSPESDPTPVVAPAATHKPKTPVEPTTENAVIPDADSTSANADVIAETPKSKPKRPSGPRPKPSGPKRASGAKPTAGAKGTGTKNKTPPAAPEVAETTSEGTTETSISTSISAPAKTDEAAADAPAAPSTEATTPIASGPSSEASESSSIPDLGDVPTPVNDKPLESNLEDLPPAPVSPPSSSSSKNKPNKNKPKGKPKPAAPKQQPVLEDEPGTSLSSGSLSDPLDDQDIGDGGYSLSKPTAAAETGKEKEKSKPTPPAVAAEKPHPLCEVFSANTAFDPSGEISVKYSIEAEHDCVKPKAMTLHLTVPGIACNYSELITEEQLVAADFLHHITLPGVGVSLVPGLQYHAQLHACKDVKHTNARECKPVPGNAGPITRPVPSVSTARTERTAIRLSIPSKISDYSRFENRMEELHFASREELLDAITTDLANLIADSNKESRTTSVSIRQRLSGQFTDPEADHMLKLSVMPPSGIASGSSLESDRIAEHIRCIFTSPSILSSSSALSLFVKPVRIEVFDPCETLLGRDLPACTKKGDDDYPVSDYRSSELNPSSSSTPYSSAAPTTRYDIDDATPNASTTKSSGPSYEANPTYDSTPSTSTYPKTPVQDDYPSSSTSESPSTSRADATEPIVDEISTPDPAPTHIVKESQWYDAFMLNPMYLMVFVGAILAVTFWALCMRTSSRAVTTESATDGDEAEQDLELGGVEMQKTAGASSNGAFSAINTMDDDATSNNSAAPLSSPGGNASTTGFTNEREDGSASRFLISVLIGIGIPSFGTSKYTSILKDNYLSTIEQLKQLDNSDWKRLGLPLVIEEALRKQLQEHTEKSGRFASGSASTSSTRAKGLDLKSAAKTVNKSTEKKKGSSILAAKPAEDSDPYEEVEANAEEGEKEKSEDKSSGSSSSKKKKEKKGKTSLLLAPPSNDSASGVSALPTDDDDDDDFLKF